MAARTKEEKIWIGGFVPASLREALAKLAEENHRTLTGEFRHALSLYVAAENEQKAA